MCSSRGGHSADVRISLMFSGHCIPVAQLGPDFLLLDAPADHHAGPTSILLHVDQSEKRRDVRLPNGISSASKRVAITACSNRSRQSLSPKSPVRLTALCGRRAV
jgi:hypothetical protein